MPRARLHLLSSLLRRSAFDIAVGLLLALLFFLLIAAAPRRDGTLDRNDHLPACPTSCWEPVPSTTTSVQF
jgi:hypothetical protein